MCTIIFFLLWCNYDDSVYIVSSYFIWSYYCHICWKFKITLSLLLKTLSNPLLCVLDPRVRTSAWWPLSSVPMITLITDQSTEDAVRLNWYDVTLTMELIWSLNDVMLLKEWQGYIIFTDGAVTQITILNYREIAPLSVIQCSSFTHVRLSNYTLPLSLSSAALYCRVCLTLYWVISCGWNRTMKYLGPSNGTGLQTGI